MRGCFQRVFHQALILLAVCLHALGLDCRALPRVQGSGLEGDEVGGSAHFSAQCVDLKHQMSLCCPSDGGVTGHIGNRVEREREEDGINAHARRRECRFDSCVPRTDDGKLCFQFVFFYFHVKLV